MVSAQEKSGNLQKRIRVKKGLKKKKKKKPFELDVDACMMIIYDPTLVDVALQKEEGFEIEEEEKEDLKNEFMQGFHELNVRINQTRITEEEENCSWLSDELDEILNAFGDNADDHHQENMFDLLAPLSDPPRLSFTNALIDNILDSTSDNWLAGTMVEWDQLFS